MTNKIAMLKFGDFFIFKITVGKIRNAEVGTKLSEFLIQCLYDSLKIKYKVPSVENNT